MGPFIKRNPAGQEKGSETDTRDSPDSSKPQARRDKLGFHVTGRYCKGQITGQKTEQRAGTGRSGGQGRQWEGGGGRGGRLAWDEDACMTGTGREAPTAEAGRSFQTEAGSRKELPDRSAR